MNDNEIDARKSVNEVILRYPPAVTVFKAFGMDTCCRGNLSLEAAALSAGVGFETVMLELEKAIGTGGR